MQRYIPRTVLTLSIASAFIVACGDDDDGNGGGGGGGGDTCPNTMTQTDIMCANNVCTLAQGNYSGVLTFTADNQYLLDGRVFIGDSTTQCAGQLTIAPGTTILGSSANLGYLAVLPNSTITAQGTAAMPIRFQSDATMPGRGDWGGLIISGNATVNCGGTGTTCNGEGDTGAYGGTTDTDNSGVLTYVRVANGGNQVNATDELNGIAFQGIGSGTMVDHIHVHLSADDGVEFFGGTVNAKHVILTGIGDDNIDWTFGWRGKLQFAVVQQHPDASDNGIEADNNEDMDDAMPRSSPILSNLTLVGAPQSSNSDIGALLREGTGAQLWNAIIMSFNDAGMDFDDDSTFTNASAMAGNLAVANAIFWNNGGSKTSESATFDEEMADPFDISDYVLRGMGMGGAGNVNNVIADPSMTPAVHNITMPSWVPTSTSIAAMGGSQPAGDAFFEAVTYRGGVEPGVAQPWYSWTTFN